MHFIEVPILLKRWKNEKAADRFDSVNFVIKCFLRFHHYHFDSLVPYNPRFFFVFTFCPILSALSSLSPWTPMMPFCHCWLTVSQSSHYDIITWKPFLYDWPFVREIHRYSNVELWCCFWCKLRRVCWTNSQVAHDLWPLWCSCDITGLLPGNGACQLKGYITIDDY